MPLQLVENAVGLKVLPDKTGKGRMLGKIVDELGLSLIFLLTNFFGEREMKSRKVQTGRGRMCREYRTCCAEIVMNVADYFVREKKAKRLLLGLNKARDRALMATGVGKTALLDDETPLLEQEQRERLSHVNEEDVARIRPAVVDLVLNKTSVTLDALLVHLRSAPNPWAWSRSTLYRAMLSLGFSYESRKHGYYERLKEDEQNVLRRAHYLQYFFRYEEEGREFVFLDESWVNKNLAAGKVWTDRTKDCEDTVPPGKGPRWILLGAGTKDGWLLPTWRMTATILRARL